LVYVIYTTNTSRMEEESWLYNHSKA
jgi:hypothetical protein